MQVILSNQESETMFHTALCNGIGYMGGYGLELKTKKQEYEAAKKSLQAGAPDAAICYEDVLLQILREGGSLKFVDLECDGEYTREVKLKDVHEKVATVPFRFLTDMINEEDDAETADVLIQTVLYGEIVFG